MDFIFNAIFEHIRKINPEIFLDIDIGQLELEAPPVSFPCALVAISSIEYSAVAGGKQKANATVDVTFGNQVIGPSDYNTDQSIREQTMAHYGEIETIVKGLKDFGCDYFSPLRRTTLSMGKNTFPRAMTVSFTTAWIEG